MILRSPVGNTIAVTPIETFSSTFPFKPLYAFVNSGYEPVFDTKPLLLLRTIVPLFMIVPLFSRVPKFVKEPLIVRVCPFFTDMAPPVGIVKSVIVTVFVPSAADVFPLALITTSSGTTMMSPTMSALVIVNVAGTTFGAAVTF
ncbi:MAG: hypothetical protein E7Z62_06345 [Thermoplasmata archaeon]|nr:hypothetical protein [Thermoplasmata archaeon]